MTFLFVQEPMKLVGTNGWPELTVFKKFASHQNFDFDVTHFLDRCSGVKTYLNVGRQNYYYWNNLSIRKHPSLEWKERKNYYYAITFSCINQRKTYWRRKSNDLVFNGPFNGECTTQFCKLLLFHLLCIMCMKEGK